MTDLELMRHAEAARAYAYAPYSHFCVGAALLGESGKIYTGCNIENAAYAPTNCAERTAFFKAISEGERRFVAIAVIGGREGESGSFCAPCGVCRQVMAEFCDVDFPIILGDVNDCTRHSLRSLLPASFGKQDIAGGADT